MQNSVKSGYDIVVIGGGAAGCSFLYNLSGSFNVLLVDYRKFPRFKACSGILVNNAKDYFSDLQLPKEILAEPVNLHLTYQDWNTNKENAVEKHFINTYRQKLDEWLFSRIKNKNKLTIAEGFKLVDFFHTKDKKFIVVVLENGNETKTIVTKHLIGCDGAISTVRRKLFNRDIAYYVAIQETIPGFKLDRAYFIFDDEITDFYCWLIPKDNAVEVGAAVLPVNSKEKFNLFKKKVEKKFGIKGFGKLESAIVLRPKSSKDIFLGKDSVMLCGEAAGLITPSSAEGISSALVSGKFCAQALNAGYANPLKLYEDKCKPLLERFEEKFKKSAEISDRKKRQKYF
ncbi:MAG: FAD-dependent monooxygenase [archaeon]